MQPTLRAVLAGGGGGGEKEGGCGCFGRSEGDCSGEKEEKETEAGGGRDGTRREVRRSKEEEGASKDEGEV